MLTLDDLRFFDALMHATSLAGAARSLGVTPPALSVRLRKAEAALDTRLVMRGPRSLQLTDAGARLVQESAALLRQLEGIGARVSAASLSLEGQLRIAAPFGFGRRHVAPVVQAFCARYPKVRVTLTLSEHPMHRPQGSDVVLHIGKLRDSSWVAHRLGANQRWLAASPAYASAHDLPVQPDDLVRHRCLCLRENDEDVSLWQLRRGRGASRTVRVTPTMLTNDGDVLCQWAESGQGVILRSQWDLAPRIAAGTLVRVLPQWQGEPADVQVLLPGRTGHTARALAFVQHAKHHLARALPQ